MNIEFATSIKKTGILSIIDIADDGIFQVDHFRDLSEWCYIYITYAEIVERHCVDRQRRPTQIPDTDEINYSFNVVNQPPASSQRRFELSWQYYFVLKKSSANDRHELIRQLEAEFGRLRYLFINQSGRTGVVMFERDIGEPPMEGYYWLCGDIAFCRLENKQRLRHSVHLETNRAKE